MGICPTNLPGPHVTLGHWSSMVSSSVFQEGTDKPPLESKNCQTDTVSSELHSHCRWLRGDLQTRADKENELIGPEGLIYPCMWNSTLNGGATGDDFRENSASIKDLGNPLVERAWLDSTVHLSCVGSMWLNTRLGMGDLGSRLSFACIWAWDRQMWGA